MNEPQQYRTVDKFDRMIGALANLPDVTHTKEATVTAVSSVTGEAQTFIVQTFRQAEQGDTIFVQYIDGDGSKRLYFPPKVANVIARQRDALGTKNRKKAAKAEAIRRKSAGILPGFMKKKA